MRKLSLGMWGGICIFAGVMSGTFSGPPATQSEMLGKACAQLLFIVIGIGLIVAHFIRRR